MSAAAPSKRVATELSVRGMTCASCVAHVTRALSKVDGVRDAAVNLATERATVLHDAQLTPAAMIAAIERAGYHAALPSGADEDAAHRDRELAIRRGLLVLAIAFTLPVVLLSMAAGDFAGKNWLLAALTLPVWGIVGWTFHRGALTALRTGATTMDTLVSLGATAAFALSLYETFAGGPTYFETAAAIITLVFIGRYLETAARVRSSRAQQGLLELRPEVTRRRLPDGSSESVPVDLVHEGDVLLVAPGERIPVDGSVISGRSSLDRALLTGEPMPVEVASGDTVEQGAVNGDGALVIRATAVGAGTTLARILETVRRAQGSTPPVQRLADRIAAVFVPVILAIAALTFAGWMVAHRPWNDALVFAVAVLVVACPCALGLATPTAVIAGIGAAARRGILFKDATSLERTAAVDSILFDKTGTLTAGMPHLLSIHAQAGRTDDDVLGVAAALEQQSTHPLARLITEVALERKVAIPQADDVAIERGRGISGTIAGQAARAGNAAFLNGIPLPAREASAATQVFVSLAGAYVGALDLGDPVRDTARGCVDGLRELHCESYLVSGDAEETVRSVAALTGIRQWFSEQLPDQKAQIVERLRAQGHRIAFVGDGINDAAALAAADIGFAMGGGTAIALEAAHATLLSNDPLATLDAIRIARGTKRAIAQNLFWAFAYNVVLIPLAAFGIVNPIFAAGAMGLSSLFVVGNSLRLALRYTR